MSATFLAAVAQRTADASSPNHVAASAAQDLQAQLRASAGSHICCKPLVFMQLADSRRGTLVCGSCGGFAAGARGQLVASKVPTSSEMLEAELAMVPGATTEHQSTFCSLGCGEIFCSPECEAMAQASGHALTCVGPLTEEAPMYHLKVVALHSGHPETVTLAIKVAALAASEKGDGGPAGASAPPKNANAAPRELLEKALKIAQEKGDLAAELKIVEALRERGDS